jgi:transposase
MNEYSEVVLQDSYKAFARITPPTYYAHHATGAIMSQKEEPKFSAYVGIDWADEKHDICLSSSDKDQLEFQVLKHNPKAIDEWAIALKKRFSDGLIAICLEQTKGPLIYALLKYDFLILYPVNPQSLSNYRKTFATSGAKDDPSDAALQLDFLMKHRDQLSPWTPDDPKTRSLQRLVEMRKNLAHEKVRLTNKITGLLKEYFPQVLDL